MDDGWMGELLADKTHARVVISLRVIPDQTQPACRLADDVAGPLRLLVIGPF